MRDAPERIWATCGEYWRYPTFKDDKTEYVRADLSDALLREAMEALIGVIPSHRFVGNFCWCHAARDTDTGHTAECLKARATLAKLRAHLGEKE